MAAGTLQFGEFELDCERFELRRKGISLRLERQPMELLILLASSGGRLVTRAEIARLLWGSDVFVDTEHGINTAIRKIRHVLRDDPESPRFLQTVTGKGYRFAGVTPNPEPTPLPAEPPPPTPQPVVPTRAPASSHRIWVSASASAVLLILIGIATFGARSVRGHTTRAAITSIAVLPLDNLSGDPSQDYLADGMTDELTTMLAKSSTLRVISRTSVMQFKGAHRPLPEIARQLNVDGILEGSLARSGDNLHMTVQLIYAPTDTHLWAESYDRSATDLVTLPHDAALSIAAETHSATNGAVSSSPHLRYINPAAHDAYLRGKFLWFSGDDQASGKYFLQATQLQPDYALAWAGLCSYYGAGAVDFWLDPRQALPLAVAAARKSIQLDPSLPEAHLDLGATYWVADWKLDAALDELNRAIELDPKQSEAWHLRSKILIQLNRFPQALEEQRKAMEITPFERPWGMAYALLMTRQFGAAITDAKQRIEGNPNPILWWVLSEAYRGKGMDKESEQALEKALVLWNDPSVDPIHRAFTRGGRDAVLRWRINNLKTRAEKHYASPYLFASYYAQLGDKQQALAWLDECLLQHAPPLLDIQNDTAFDSLHSDPHYRAIVQKIGLPPAY
jgi:TolB-like protein/DNA-binding winged helix-turn-helix (wHTH) protein/cytochrome c-type biogenesis protein CcmH/NrfG